MISSNFYSRVTDTIKDAAGFAVALAISLLVVGFTAFYSITAALTAVAICTSVVLAIELFLVLFVDPNRGYTQEVPSDNPYKESWRKQEIIESKDAVDIFDNYDITIEGTSNEKAR